MGNVVNRVAPVSYTHLDVYKRQGLSLPKSLQKAAMAGWEMMMVPSTSNRAALIFKDNGFVVKGIFVVCRFAFGILKDFNILKPFIIKQNLGKRKKIKIKKYLTKDLYTLC